MNRTIIVNGVSFTSAAQAARHFGGSTRALDHAICRGASKWKGMKLEVLEVPEPEPIEFKDFCPRIDAILEKKERTNYGGLMARRIVSL